MSGPKKFTTRDAASPKTHTTAKITVVEKRGGATFEVEKASVEIKGAGGKTSGTTNDKGNFTTGLFRAGKYDVIVKADEMGPPGTVVKEGPITVSIDFLPNDSLPSGKTTNEVTITIQQRNPKIHVTVFEDKLGLGPALLQGADVEIIGLIKGTSDKNGKLSSPEAKFGKHTVKVTKAGLLPQNQAGSAFFREVELRENGMSLHNKSRDLDIEVTLGPMQAAIPPLTNDPIRIWASGGHTPHTVAEDPRLPSPGGGDKPEGQDGWDMGINFSTFHDLAVRLSRKRAAHLGGADIQDHQVSRLAIVAHGAPGVVDVDQTETGGFGLPTPAESRSLTVARLANYQRELDKIADALRQDSVVYLASCQAADGKEGEALLKALSKRWPTTKVVGLRTLGTVVHGMFKPGVSPKAFYAGIRDTKFANGNKKPGEIRDYEDPAVVADLGKLPWLSETSRHATVALDGNIIRRGDGV